MSAIVRIFTHSGLSTAKVDASGGRFTSDSVFFLKQPYLGNATITATSSGAQSSPRAIAKKGTALVHVQVQPGKTVFYEINPSNRDVPASTDSPTLTGSSSIEFGPDWSISVLESI
jgi:hypothetical protein